MSQPEASKEEAARKAGERIREKRSVRSNPAQWLDEIRSGNRAALGSSITLLESQRNADKEAAQELLQMALPYSGKSKRIGITGVPGVGKSTFIEALGLELVGNGHRLAVLAIDPSSQRTGGSILGDKTRMESLSAHASAFIRPSPASDALGGVARRTREAIVLCEAAGYDIIVVETVGVGQSEIAVHGMVDCFLLLMLAGAGDELQGIKRGIMEMADVIAVTKADGQNVDASKKAVRAVKNALHLFPAPAHGWLPTVLTCSSLERSGVNEVWDAVESCLNHFILKGEFDRRRKEQDLSWFRETVKTELWHSFMERPEIVSRFHALEKDVTEGKITPFAAASALWRSYHTT